jgi:MurNAc alpha-1-phosphate uridylyltransferase
MPHFGDAAFFIINSDSIWVERGIPALPALQAAWDEQRMDGLLLLADMDTALGYDGKGDFALDAQGHVLRARDAAGLPAFAYPGVQIVHPRLFAGAPSGAFSTNLMWDRAIASQRLFGLRLDGTWLHVGTPQARDEAEHLLKALPA